MPSTKMAAISDRPHCVKMHNCILWIKVDIASKMSHTPVLHHKDCFTQREPAEYTL